ncbi:MAG: transporter substrate-binding domain-containing protein [Bacillota bacterium]|nr:transporter substrate-binding domain-containing protein [Bacillota bacterium]
MKKGLILLLPILTVAGLASCGGNSSNTDTLVVGLECNYTPFNWTQSTANDYTLPISNAAGKYADGYDVQVAKALSEATGKEVTIVRTVWESLITDLNYGNINLIIAGMTDTEERREAISFTDEYYRSELVLITDIDVANQYTSIVSESDFASLVSGKIIVSQVSTVTNDIIDTFASEYGAIHGPALSTFALAATDVMAGSAFAMTAEYPVAQSIVAANSDELGIIRIDQEILGEEAAELGVSIGIRKDDTDLQSELNEALATLDQNWRNETMVGAVNRSVSAEEI